MMNLKVDEANFKSERAVVEEEYRQRVLASPYGRLFNAFSSASYLEHPYKRPAIGSIEDLEAATLADVVAFHTRYYRPDNATLIVAGDFDPKQLDALDRQVLRRRAEARRAAAARSTPSEPAVAERPQRRRHRPAGAAAGGRDDLAGAAGDERRRAGAAGRRRRARQRASRRASTSRSSTASASRRRPASAPTCASAPAC